MKSKWPSISIKAATLILLLGTAIVVFAYSPDDLAFGTSVLPASKVWFTLRRGIFSEAHYPNLKTQNLTALYFIVTDGKSFIASERDPEVIRQLIQTDPRSLSFQQINKHPVHNFTITKSYCAYPDYSTVLIDVNLRAPAQWQLYIVFDPAMGNSETNDTAVQFGGQGAIVAYENNLCAALIADPGFEEISIDAVGKSDGVEDLSRHFKLTKQTPRAAQTNVIGVARIKQPQHFLLALSFSDTPEKALVEAEHCLESSFKETLMDYEKGWSQWLKTIGRPNLKGDPSFDLAAMMLKAREEKNQ